MTDLNLERSVHSVAGGMVNIKPIFNFLSQIINNSLFLKTAFKLGFLFLTVFKNFNPKVFLTNNISFMLTLHLNKKYYYL